MHSLICRGKRALLASNNLWMITWPLWWKETTVHSPFQKLRVASCRQLEARCQHLEQEAGAFRRRSERLLAHRRVASRISMSTGPSLQRQIGVFVFSGWTSQSCGVAFGFPLKPRITMGSLKKKDTPEWCNKCRESPASCEPWSPSEDGARGARRARAQVHQSRAKFLEPIRR